MEIVANHLFEVSGGEELMPEKATLCGPGMVAPQEYSNLTCRITDTDILLDDPGALARQLLEEVRTEPVDSMVSYRRGRRWVQAYEPVRLPQPAAERVPLRQRGVYLITGGLGGVGLVLARYLARTVEARLVLVGRSEFPAREFWTRWIEENGSHDPTSLRIRQLQALEELGAELLVLQADVSDYDAMSRVFATAEVGFGPINGIVHAAGSVGIQAFREIREAATEDSEGQFVSKVHGLLVLDRLAEGRKLDFCALTSSLSAILGGLGFSAYSAGNLFMDAFARWKNRVTEVPWTSMNWDSWRLADVRPLIAGLGATVNEFVMLPDEGTAAFERILAEGNLSQVVISSGDLHARLRQWIARQPAAQTAGPVTRHERPGLATTYVAPRGELEQTLADIWQELFGLVQVGVNDNFFELGGHSLLATQLNARLYDRVRVEMSLASLLQAPTIAQLATAIVNAQAQAADESELEKMLSEIDQLSESDVQSFLAGGASSSG
jgi:NAD(P)-dependent dehydrogenase (short-subunit alcohol dehydrogenase family)/acyl carrier protein